MFGKAQPRVGIPVDEVDVLPQLEPSNIPTSTEMLVEIMLVADMLIIGINI